MFRRILNLIIKELRDLFRNPRSAAVLIAPVIIQGAIYPFVGTMEVKNCTVGILNDDSGREATELVQRIEASPYIETVNIYRNYEEWSHALDSQDVLANMHIPSNFSSSLHQDGYAVVQCVADGRRSNSSQIVCGYMGRIASDMMRDKGRYNDELVTVNHLYNSELEYQWMILPSLVGLITALSCVMISSLSLARETEEGTYEQLLVTPLTHFELLIGKIVPSVLIALLQGSILIAGAVFVYGVPLNGSLALLYLALILFAFSLAGVGLAFSSLCKTQQQAFIATFCFLVPAIILSGFLSPVENMPFVLRCIARLDPVTYLVAVLKGVFLKGYGFHNAWSDLAAFVIISAVTLSVAYVILKKKSGTA